MSAARVSRGSVRYALCIACCCATVASVTAQPPPAAVPLQEGRPQTATQSAEDRFRYDVDIGAGTYVVRLEQRGLDLKLAVESPGGAAETHDSPTLRDGEEIAVLTGPGRYRVLLNSDSGLYGGANMGSPDAVAEPHAWHQQPCSLLLDLPPLAAQILVRES